MQLSQYRLEKIKLPDNIEKISLDNLSKEDKAMYDMVFQAFSKYKKVWSKNDPKRLQQFAYILVNGIKTNVESFYSEDSTKNAFKKALADKITDDLSKTAIEGKNLFTNSDIEKIIDESFSLMKKDEFVQKYLGILTKQEIRNKINSFVKELNKAGGTSEENFKKSALVHSKALTNLSETTKKLISNTNIAKSIQDKVSKQLDDLKAQTERISRKDDKKPSSSTAPTSTAERIVSSNKTKTSLISSLLTFGGFGLAAKGIASFFKPDRRKHGLATNSTKSISEFFKKTKTNLSLQFFSFRKKTWERAEKIKTSLFGWSKKLGHGVAQLGKFTIKTIGVLLLAPFYFLGKGIAALFKKKEDENKKIPFFTKVKQILKSPKFLFFLGFIIGYMYKMILKIWNPIKDWTVKIFNGILTFLNWTKDAAVNIFEKVRNFWYWLSEEVDWGKIWEKIKEKLPTLDTLFSAVKKIYDKVRMFFNNKWVERILSIGTGLKKFFEFLKETKIGRKALQVVGIIAKGKDFLVTLLSAGIGFAVAAVSSGFARMFKGWHKNDKDDTSRDAYDLSEEYKKSLGVGLTSIGKRLQMQFKSATSEATIKKTNDIIEKSIATGEAINGLLGDSKKEGSLAWFAERLPSTTKTFRDFERDKLDEIFSFDFLTGNPNFLATLRAYSANLKNYFMVSDSLAQVLPQQNFLEYVLRMKNEMLFTNAFLMQHLNLNEFLSVLDDSEYFRGIANKNILGIFGLLDMGRWNRDSWEMKNPKDELDAMIHQLKPKLYDLRKAMLIKYTDRYSEKDKARLKIPISIQSMRNSNHPFVEAYGLRGGQRIFSSNGFDLFNLLYNFKEKDKPWYYSDMSLSLFDDATPSPLKWNAPTIFTGSDGHGYNSLLTLDRRVAYDRMINAIDIKSKQLEEALDKGWEYVESLDWKTLRYMLGDGQSLDDTKERIDSKSERYLFEMLWKIFDAAERAGL